MIVAHNGVERDRGTRAAQLIRLQDMSSNSRLSRVFVPTAIFRANNIEKPMRVRPICSSYFSLIDFCQ